MNGSSARDPQARAALFGALATLALTAAHHAYGGVRYDTPWRLHGAFVAVLLGAPLLVASSLYRRNRGTRLGRAAGWILAALVLLFPVLIVGGFEGFYNHLVKNVMFLAGAPLGLLQAMFPPPTYELPNDAWFEVSGVLQVVPAALAGRAAFRLARSLWVGAGTRRATPAEASGA